MRFGKNVKYRIRVYPSGKRVKVALLGNRIVDTEPMRPVRQTKSRKRLARKRRRIGLR
jgi:hypothetical protein